jgi:hypothetical protein
VTAPKLTEPGVYDLPADVYHTDPIQGGSLSSTGARKLLDPSCPAAYRYWADHPEEHKKTFDYGQAAHALVLGAGRGIAVVDAADWRTKAAREAREAAYAEDRVPLLVHEHEQVVAMAAALRDHPIAGPLLDPDSGRAEQTLVWRDQATGVMRRAMLDWLPDPGDGRLIVPDYKTAAKVDPESLRKAMHQHGYYQQAPWYLDGVRALDLHGGIDPAFVFVFQAKDPPYLVTIGQPDPDALLWGSRRNREAIATFAHCTATGHWPGHAGDKVISLELPAYATRQLENAWELGELTAHSGDAA